jgi:hypothetical protein
VSFGFSNELSRHLNVFKISPLSKSDIFLYDFSFNTLYSAVIAPTASISFCPSEIGRTSSDSFK